MVLRTELSVDLTEKKVVPTDFVRRLKKLKVVFYSHFKSCVSTQIFDGLYSYTIIAIPPILAEF
jgi:hypothetical protein